MPCCAVPCHAVPCRAQVPEDTSLDAKGQTADVLRQIDALLARAGTDKTKILMAQARSWDLGPGTWDLFG